MHYLIRIRRACLVLLLTLGAMLSLFGMLIVPGRPYFQLDVVLSREELLDVAKREATLAMLKKADGNLWIFCSTCGISITMLSAVALACDKKVSPNRV